MPGLQKFSIKLPSFCRISTEKTFKFNKKTPVHKLPRGAIYKPPCVQLINNPFFAIHQVLHCQDTETRCFGTPNAMILKLKRMVALKHVYGSVSLGSTLGGAGTGVIVAMKTLLSVTQAGTSCLAQVPSQGPSSKNNIEMCKSWGFRQFKAKSGNLDLS